jgi:hypothetical protein
MVLLLCLLAEGVAGAMPSSADEKGHEKEGRRTDGDGSDQNGSAFSLEQGIVGVGGGRGGAPK